MGTTKVTSAQLRQYRGASSAALKRAVGKRLREAAEVIAEAAREISGQFSTRIPASIVVRGGTTQVWIVAGGEAAPNAAPFEDGSFHPVFARGPRSKWTWRRQPHRPFLEEAELAAGNEAAEAFAQIIDDWSDEIFH